MESTFQPDPNKTDSENAADFAAHKAKSAQMAVEMSREIHMEEAIRKTALETKAALLEGLKEVFGDGDEKDPEQMRILVRRIPILCTNVEAMHSDISELKDTNKWTARIVIGAVILAVLKLIFIP